MSVKPYTPLPKPPEDRPARVRVKLREGGEIAEECLSAQGGPDRPYPPSVLTEKVRSLTTSTYPNLEPTLFALMNAARARNAGSWGDIVGQICAA